MPLPTLPSSPYSLKSGIKRKILPLSGTEYQLSKNNQFIVNWRAFGMTCALTDFGVSDVKRRVDEVRSLLDVYAAYVGSCLSTFNPYRTNVESRVSS